jgi:hypothetical protein
LGACGALEVRSWERWSPSDTALTAVDDTDQIRAIGADGIARPVTKLLAWDRHQDWAVLVSDAPSADSLTVAAAEATKVGDRCFSMEGSAAGGRVLTEGSITGQDIRTAGARRLIVAFLNGSGTPGAPVVNEFGELIGIVGGSGVPGASRMIHIFRFRADLKGAPVVPFTAVRVRPDGQAATLNEARAQGDLVMTLTADEHVVSGGFARAINKGPVVAPADQREDFSLREQKFVVFVNWSPQERLKGQTLLRVFDADNRVVVESKPLKSDFRKGQPILSS